MKKRCDCCGLPMTYDVDESCIDCALLTIDDEVAQHACAMAVTHLIAEAIKDPTLGMPGLRSIGGSVTHVPPRAGPELGVSRSGAFPVRPDRHQPVSQTVAKDCQGGCGKVKQFTWNPTNPGHGNIPMVWHCSACFVEQPKSLTEMLKAWEEVAKEPVGQSGGCSLCHAPSQYAKSDTRGRCYDCSVKP